MKHINKEELQEGEIIISGDLSENYSLKQQNEKMTAHWGCDTLTLFCATVHYKQDGKKRFCITSLYQVTW